MRGGLLVIPLLSTVVGCASPSATRGVRLESLTWIEAERLLTPEAVVVIPIGAAAKEHGPHLKLNNDLLLAEYFAQRVLEGAEVVIAPTVNYHFYPAFVEYPGSTTLRVETARDLVVDVVKSLARYGPRRFYALNTGISTVRALAPAAEALAAEGILFRYTDLGAALGPIEEELCTQARVSHAVES
jgi:creatinine amidohydrolase